MLPAGRRRDSLDATIDTVIELGVDRVAVYNFAYLPERVRHQRAIDPAELPTADTRVELSCLATARFSAAGYDMIGMDHFARHDDELARARRDGTMQRNFMGYTTRAGHDLLAFGILQCGFAFRVDDRLTGPDVQRTADDVGAADEACGGAGQEHDCVGDFFRRAHAPHRVGGCA